MYKHILVPTDGSKLSDRAIKEAARLAAGTGAKLTLLHAAPTRIWPVYAESAVVMAEFSNKHLRAQMQAEGEALLAKAAKRAGVQAATEMIFTDVPWDAIVKTATKLKCDLVVMASHGHRGLAGFLLGSETQKVLTHCKTPVLVVR